VNLEGALTWAFEFEEQPYFAGFRSLASNGIDKPVLNVFRMFSKMRGQRLPVKSDGALTLDEITRRGVRGKPDVAALASSDGKQIAVLLWHYHDDDVPGPSAKVELSLNGLPVEKRLMEVRHYRIDEDHSNAFSAWKLMGSPQQPTPEQYAKLEQAGKLASMKAPEAGPAANGETVLRLELPRQAVSLLMLQF
jgi:xylan 1,4-beta-xylosidase